MATTGGPPATGIVTPEAVLLEFETAGVASRTIAELLDLRRAVRRACRRARSSLAFVGAPPAGSATSLAVVLSLSRSFLVLVGYPTVMETFWNGRTLGKAAMGLRVVTRGGRARAVPSRRHPGDARPGRDLRRSSASRR